MEKSEQKFYIIREDILPAAILKTAQAKDMLQQGKAANILEAVDALGMARSTFYKYKDGVFPFFDSSETPILNLLLMLKNMPGILSGILNYIAEQRGNILTINQSIPMHGSALVTITVNMEASDATPAQLVNSLSRREGVIRVQMIGRS